MPENEPVEVDPYSPDNIGIVQFIQLSRIYDVLLAQFSATHPAKAADLIALHGAGKLLGPNPYFDGNFLSDEDDTVDVEVPPQ